MGRFNSLGGQSDLAHPVNLLFTFLPPVWQFFYSSESWVLSLDIKSKINAIAASCYRIMLGMKLQDCISIIAIHSMTNTEPLVYYVRKRQLGFLGHILRLLEEDPARRYAFYVPPDGKRKPGRPRTSYTTYIQRVLVYHDVDISADEIAALSCWRSMCMEKSCNRLLRSRRMMMIMISRGYFIFCNRYRDKTRF